MFCRISSLESANRRYENQLKEIKLEIRRTTNAANDSGKRRLIVFSVFNCSQPQLCVAFTSLMSRIIVTQRAIVGFFIFATVLVKSKPEVPKKTYGDLAVERFYERTEAKMLTDQVSSLKEKLTREQINGDKLK